jgi:hypothetical protein
VQMRLTKLFCRDRKMHLGSRAYLTPPSEREKPLTQ